MVVNRRFLFAWKPIMFQGVTVMFPGLVTDLVVSTGSGLSLRLSLIWGVGKISVHSPFDFWVVFRMGLCHRLGPSGASGLAHRLFCSYEVLLCLLV